LLVAPATRSQIKSRSWSDSSIQSLPSWLLRSRCHVQLSGSSHQPIARHTKFSHFAWFHNLRRFSLVETQSVLQEKGDKDQAYRATQTCASAASSTGVFIPSHNPELPATRSEGSAPCPSSTPTIYLRVHTKTQQRIRAHAHRATPAKRL
jgi:hypothetical protein